MEYLPPPPRASSAAVRASMRGNRRRDTRPELAVRSALHRHGLRYRVDFVVLTAAGRVRPDIVFTRRRLAVFIDGCFWHGCEAHSTTPRTNTIYWTSKLSRNLARDRRNDAALRAEGWQVLRIWEHEQVENAVASVLLRYGSGDVG